MYILYRSEHITLSLTHTFSPCLPVHPSSIGGHHCGVDQVVHVSEISHSDCEALQVVHWHTGTEEALVVIEVVAVSVVVVVV